jgi:hypothetical protein
MSKGIILPSNFTKRRDPAEVAHHDAAVEARQRCLKAVDGFDWPVAVDILLNAIGIVIAKSVPRGGITKAVEVIIGEGGSNPNKPGLLEKVVRECTRRERTRGKS